MKRLVLLFGLLFAVACAPVDLDEHDDSDFPEDDYAEGEIESIEQASQCLATPAQIHLSAVPPTFDWVGWPQQSTYASTTPGTGHWYNMPTLSLRKSGTFNWCNYGGSSANWTGMWCDNGSGPVWYGCPANPVARQANVYIWCGDNCPGGTTCPGGANPASIGWYSVPTGGSAVVGNAYDFWPGGNGAVTSNALRQPTVITPSPFAPGGGGGGKVTFLCNYAVTNGGYWLVGDTVAGDGI